MLIAAFTSRFHNIRRCVSTQSYTVALRSVIFAASLCRQICIRQLAATQYCIWKHHSTMMRLCHSGILLLLSVQNSYLVAAVWCEAMPTGYRVPDVQAVSSSCQHMSVEPIVCGQNGCKCLGSRVTCHRQRHAVHGCLASTAELAGTELISVIHPTLTAQLSS